MISCCLRNTFVSAKALPRALHLARLAYTGLLRCVRSNRWARISYKRINIRKSCVCGKRSAYTRATGASKNLYECINRWSENTLKNCSIKTIPAFSFFAFAVFPFFFVEPSLLTDFVFLLLFLLIGLSESEDDAYESLSSVGHLGSGSTSICPASGFSSGGSGLSSEGSYYWVCSNVRQSRT